ncbi:MAG: glycosyltransferase family 39 protein [Chlamydiota bacterium]
MSGISLHKTASLITVAAFFLFAGCVFTERASSRLVVRYLSSDGAIEEVTALFLRQMHHGLLAVGGILALMGLVNALAARRPAITADRPGRRRAAFAVFMLFAASLLYLSPYNAMRMLNEDPVRYACAAYNIYTGKGDTITLAGRDFPDKFFFGYPLSIVLFYAVFGPFLGNAVYATLTWALLALAATYLLGRRLFGTKAAFMAVILLCTNGLFLDLGREIRSDMTACALLAIACVLFVGLGAGGKGGRRAAFLLGLTFGAAYTVRPYLLCALVPIPFALWRRRGAVSMAARMGVLGIGLLLLVIPTMIYCAVTFGGMLRSGYHVWWNFDLSAPFKLRNIYTLMPTRWDLFPPQNIIQECQRLVDGTSGLFYGAALLGMYGLYSPAVFIFIALGVAESLNARGGLSGCPRAVAASLCAIVALCALVIMMYSFRDIRFLLPLLPVLFVFAGAGMARHVRVSYQRYRGAPALIASVLFACAMSAAPLAIYSRVTTPPDPPYQYGICMRYDRALPIDGCIISGVDPLLLEHCVLRDSARTLRAISDTGFYVDVPVRLKPGDEAVRIPVEPVSRFIDEIRARIDADMVVLTDDWEDPHRAGQCRREREMLRAQFAHTEVARAGPFRVYRLSILPEGTARWNSHSSEGRVK